ncbi:Rhodanese-related sulfurtransferase [Geodermatophilus telluris]|uniref:Rhodanese-related sulfurtransferase n=1 Tax=Geodermatophilus telluris TaxID=1190417 RepID=A0A1G6QKP2_9ACTN|nr:rhodanese-like domain-containing protein [Geodermatophilus telluris]SDC92584.1 Rhodanese-related sulfurtransferase [Geodermatophilus telluris]
MTRAIDAPTLAERLGDDHSPDPALVDVRTPAEFEAGHIPGATNVPLDQLRSRLADLREPLGDADVVLVCRSGARAGQAQQVMRMAGLGAPAVLSGGMVDWERAGLAVDRGRQVWDLERQVRFAAGSLVVTGTLGSLVAPRLKWLSGVVGGGLVFAAVSNSCAMGMALARMPWNRRGNAAVACTVGTPSRTR